MHSQFHGNIIYNNKNYSESMRIHGRKCFKYFTLVIQRYILQTLDYSYKHWIVKYKNFSASDSIGNTRKRNF